MYDIPHCTLRDPHKRWAHEQLAQYTYMTSYYAPGTRVPSGLVANGGRQYWFLHLRGTTASAHRRRKPVSMPTKFVSSMA